MNMRKLPPELIKECAELGYFGFTVPEEYGGLGQKTVTFMGVLEEICARLGRVRHHALGAQFALLRDHQAVRVG